MFEYLSCHNEKQAALIFLHAEFLRERVTELEDLKMEKILFLEKIEWLDFKE